MTTSFTPVKRLDQTSQAEVFTVDGMTILVPLQKVKQNRLPGSYIDDVCRAELAESFYNLRLAIRRTYGSKVSAAGPLVGISYYNNISEFQLTGMESAQERIIGTLRKQNTDSADTLISSLERKRESFPLFSVDSETGHVFGFNEKLTSLFAAAKKVDPSFVSKMDPTFKAVGFTRPTGPLLTIADLIRILDQTRKTMDTMLTSAGVTTTTENTSALLELIQMKTDRVVVGAFKQMPWLKIEKRVDQNLALMVGQGFSYEWLLIFDFFKKYPSDAEEFNSMIHTPRDYLFRMLS